MKDNINKLARGEFVYNTPSIAISEANIQINIQVGSTFSGEFEVIGDSEIKGIVYSTDNLVTVNNSSFIGVENTIQYTVDTIGVHSNDIIEGQFNIVSDAGEFILPYSFKIIEKEIETSMGKVNNLFHFANLAQMASEEAQKLFTSEEFPRVFLKNDVNLMNVYYGLYQEENIRNSIEEFLIAVHKKSFISLSLSKSSKIYENFVETIKDTVILKKSTWGYIECTIESDSDFINLSNNSSSINSDAFIGNKYELEYLLDRSKMHSGKNFGRIIITTAYQTLTYEIEVDNFHINILDKDATELVIYNREKKRAIADLTKNYLLFRVKQIDLRNWIERSNKALESICEKTDEDSYFKLVQAQLYYFQQNLDTAKWLLDNVRDDVLQNKENHIVLYCYFLYVNSLIKRDPQYSNDILNIVRKYYENGHDEWQLLWIMFYVNEDYENNQSIKLARIKEQFHKGCKSPILYLEACNIFNAQPMLLRVLNHFELQVIHFACKNNIIQEKLAQQICELCKNEKSVSKTYLRILKKVYEKFPGDLMLNVLSTNLIRNEISGSEVFDIYEKSILKNLRITKLYEYYMDSVDLKSKHQYPKMVLLYFAYNNQLDADKKASLYANIIYNKDKDTNTYHSYKKQIELFAIDQLQKGKINDDYILIYKEFWDKSLIKNETVDTISKILFTYKLTCTNNHIKYVIVRHKELDTQERIPLINQVAYIQIYTENCSILFEDEFGVRRKDSISHEVVRVCEDSDFAQLVFEQNNYDLGILLYFSELNYQYHKNNSNSNKIQNILLNHVDVSSQYKKVLRNSILSYYYNEYNGDEFEQYFSEINTDNLSEIEATMLIEICIIQNMFENAYELILLYGFRKVNPKRLFRLCRRMIQIMNYENNELMVDMCNYIFHNKKYDDVILEYLVSYFNGTSSQMYEICEACYNFNFEAYELEERLISQLLFTNSMPPQLHVIFDNYYQRGAKDRIVEAYLEYNAYHFFVKEEDIPTQVFSILENRLLYGDENSTLCDVALLKYYETLTQLEDKQIQLARTLLDKLCLDNFIFTFYKNLDKKINLPYNAMDKTVVEFRTDPNYKVIINYMIYDKYRNQEEKKMVFVKETMKNTLNGVFTKSFTLLYAETLEYYFTIISKGEEKSTGSSRIIYNSINTVSTNGRFDYINDMYASRELHDLPTLHKLVHSYSVQDYVTKQLFKPF